MENRLIQHRLLPFWMLVFWLATTLVFWFLAFFPLPASPPQWMLSAKSACFGTLPNGLPDSFGWLTLTLAPLSLLIGILVVWPKDIRYGFQKIVSRFSGKILLLMLSVTVLWQGIWIATRIQDGLAIDNMSFLSTETGSLPETYPRTSKPAPDWSLIDQYGDNLTLGSFKGKTVFLTFAFAHCQTVCPSIIKQTLLASQDLEPKELEQLRIAIITLDPWRDTPGSLPGLAKEWNLPQQAHLFSGDPTLVTTALDHYQIPWKRDKITGNVDHPPITYVIDPNGNIAYTFNNPSPLWLKDAFRIVSSM